MEPGCERGITEDPFIAKDKLVLVVTDVYPHMSQAYVEKTVISH